MLPIILFYLHLDTQTNAMRRNLHSLLFILLLLFVSATVIAQKNILIIEKPGTVKNYKYYLGSRIKLDYTYDNKFDKVAGTISKITDSTLIINKTHLIYISNITTIYRSRYGFSLLTQAGIKGGAAFFIVDGLNRALTGTRPIFKKETAIISGSLISGGLLFLPFVNKPLRINNEDWRIKIIDTSY